MKEEKISSKLIYDGKVIKVKCDEISLDNGKTSKREVVEHLGGVCGLVKTKDEKIVFVSQYRYAVGDVVLELPAGKIERLDIGIENVNDAIIRELQEEVGIKSLNVISLGYILPTPGYSSEKIYLFYVDEYEECEINLDEDEDLRTSYISIDEAYKLIDNGTIIDAKTICLLEKCRRFLIK